jgi:hypothetical protein
MGIISSYAKRCKGCGVVIPLETTSHTVTKGNQTLTIYLEVCESCADIIFDELIGKEPTCGNPE